MLNLTENFMGYSPKLLQVDKIYGSNKNRKWFKERNIEMIVIPKEKKLEITDYQKRKQIKEYNERDQIEGKFEQAKQAYGLNNIKPKFSDKPPVGSGLLYL